MSQGGQTPRQPVPIHSWEQQREDMRWWHPRYCCTPFVSRGRNSACRSLFTRTFACLRVRFWLRGLLPGGALLQGQKDASSWCKVGSTPKFFPSKVQRRECSTANRGISRGFSYTVTVQVRLFFEHLNFHVKHIPSHYSCRRVWKDHTNILWRFEKVKEIRSFPVVGGLLRFSIKNISWMEGVVVLNNLPWFIFF